MDYCLHFDSIDKVDWLVKLQIKGWEFFLDRAEQQVDQLIATNDFTGNTADRMKEYMRVVHKLLLQNLRSIVTSCQGNWNSYKANVQSLDTHLHAVLDTSDMAFVQAGLKRHKSSAADIMEDVRKAFATVEDIMGMCVRVDCSELEDGMDACCRILQSMQGLVAEVEENFLSRFVSLEEPVAATRKSISDAMAQDTVYRQNFTKEGYASSDAFQNLYASTMRLTQENNYRQAEYQQALEINNKREEALKKEAEQIRLEEERKKREEKAGIFKFCVSALCTVVEVAVTVSTGGAGTIAAKTVTGLIQGTTNYFIDKVYVAQEPFSMEDLGRNMVCGTAKGLIDGTVSTAFMGFTADMNVLGKATMGGLESLTTGGADRFLDTYAEEGNLADAISNAGDLKEVGKDVVGGFVKDGSKDFISGGIDGITNWAGKAFNVPKGYDAGTIINKGVTSVVTGVETRVTDAGIEHAVTGDTSGYAEILDPGTMGNDFVKGSAKEIGKEGGTQKAYESKAKSAKSSSKKS